MIPDSYFHVMYLDLGFAEEDFFLLLDFFYGPCEAWNRVHLCHDTLPCLLFGFRCHHFLIHWNNQSINQLLLGESFTSSILTSLVNGDRLQLWPAKLTEEEWRTYASVNMAIIGSYNSLSPTRRQAIIWTNAGIFLIGPLGISFSEILIKIHTFSFKKMWKSHLENGGHFF